MEMLEFCIRFHDYRIKYFILGNSVTRRVTALMEHRDRFLQLAAVRLLRTIIAIRDSFYDRHLIRNRYCDAIMALLVRNNGANNLVDSSILELLHFIAVVPLPELAKDIVSRHRETLLSVRYVNTCVQLVNLVDSWEKESSGKPLGRSPDSQRKRSRGSCRRVVQFWFCAHCACRTAVGDADEEWLEGDDDNEHDSADAHSESVRPLQSVDSLLLLPSALGMRRSLDDAENDDDALPRLSRHDTPPLSFEFVSAGAGTVFGSARVRLCVCGYVTSS